MSSRSIAVADRRARWTLAGSDREQTPSRSRSTDIRAHGWGAAASGLAGILPVRRGGHGAYAALLAAARPALEAGRTVVIYPEGTRSTDGQVGEFHSGAVRLAADCGAALVPVAVLGTRDVLPKHGQVRRAPMEVRIGVPRAAEETDAAQLRSDVLALLDKGPAWARPTMRQADRGDARRARAHRWLDCDRAGGLRRRELRAAWFGPVIAIIRTRRGCERL